MSDCAMVAAIVPVILAASPVLAQPPFGGTVWISPDIITSTDLSGLTGVTYAGRGDRTIWDYRVLDWITVNAYLFEARIHGHSIEFQVNPEFGSEDASRAEVDIFAAALGRLPAVLLSRLRVVHVNAGDSGLGGNWYDQSVSIHAGDGRRTLRQGFYEEALFHEGAHVSFQNHQDAPGWRAAQEADGEYISDYARDFPDREDVAESLLPYFALRYRPGRLSASQRAAIRETIPNRMEYFDGLALDWSPYIRRPGSLDDGVKDLVDEALDELNDGSNGRQATESVPALPGAGVLLLATLLGLLGQRRLRAG